MDSPNNSFGTIWVAMAPNPMILPPKWPQFRSWTFIFSTYLAHLGRPAGRPARPAAGQADFLSKTHKTSLRLAPMHHMAPNPIIPPPTWPHFRSWMLIFSTYLAHLGRKDGRTGRPAAGQADFLAKKHETSVGLAPYGPEWDFFNMDPLIMYWGTFLVWYLFIWVHILIIFQG